MTKKLGLREQVSIFMKKMIELQKENDKKANENLKRIKEYSEKIVNTHKEMEAMKEELKIKINNFLLVLQEKQNAETSATTPHYGE